MMSIHRSTEAFSDVFTCLTGNWSGVKASFTLQRLYSFQVIHLYVPSGLIVVLSWQAFLLPRAQSPARVTLGVTSVLTIVTILTMSNNAMSKVSTDDMYVNQKANKQTNKQNI